VPPPAPPASCTNRVRAIRWRLLSEEYQFGCADLKTVAVVRYGVYLRAGMYTTKVKSSYFAPALKSEPVTRNRRVQNPCTVKLGPDVCVTGMEKRVFCGVRVGEHSTLCASPGPSVVKAGQCEGDGV
jgi:hypothetical protein